MTVQTAETKTHYAGNGLTTEWPIPFPVVREEHIKLIKTSPDGEDEEITTGYTVNGMESGAVSITYPTTGDPLGAGWQLTIYREMPLTQTLNLESGGAFDAEVIERQGFDHLVMQIQQVQEQASRALLVAITDVDRDPNKVIDEIFVAKNQAAAAASSAEQSASDSAAAAQEAQDLLGSVGVGTATASGFTPLAPEGWKAGHGLILNEDGTTSYGPLVVPDGKSIILNASNQVAASPHLPGVASFQTLTISSGTISPTVADVVVDTEGAAAADDLTDINVTAAQNGMILRLWAVNEARKVTVKHSSTLQLAGEVDRVLSQHGYLELKRNGSCWQETPRKDVLELQAGKLSTATYTANNTYSSSEFDTGKKWIDGKTIYGKYFDLGIMPDSTSKYISTGIVNFSRWVKIEGLLSDTIISENANAFPLNYAAGANTIRVSGSIDGTRIRAYASFNATHCNGYAYLEYVKTS